MSERQVWLVFQWMDRDGWKGKMGEWKIIWAGEEMDGWLERDLVGCNDAQKEEEGRRGGWVVCRGMKEFQFFFQ